MGGEGIGGGEGGDRMIRGMDREVGKGELIGN